jgi:hypothetical protein
MSPLAHTSLSLDHAGINATAIHPMRWPPNAGRLAAGHVRLNLSNPVIRSHYGNGFIKQYVRRSPDPAHFPTRAAISSCLVIAHWTGARLT